MVRFIFSFRALSVSQACEARPTLLQRFASQQPKTVEAARDRGSAIRTQATTIKRFADLVCFDRRIRRGNVQPAQGSAPQTTR
jgi:hypothetical protein